MVQFCVCVRVCVFPLYSFYTAKLQVSTFSVKYPIAIASRIYVLGALQCHSDANHQELLSDPTS